MIKWLCTNKIVNKTLVVSCHSKMLTSDKRKRSIIVITINDLAAMSQKGLFKITAERQNNIVKLKQLMLNKSLYTQLYCNLCVRSFSQPNGKLNT